MKSMILALGVTASIALLTVACGSSETTDSAAPEMITSCRDQKVEACIRDSAECAQGDGNSEPSPEDVRACCENVVGGSPSCSNSES